jgi:hypothetical protein
MKMLVITSIKEDMQAVTNLLEKAEIPVFSVSETIGHKAAHHDYLLENWFGKSNEQTDALFFFSFTDNEKAYSVLQEVLLFNEGKKSLFPIRAFILPVDLASY